MKKRRNRRKKSKAPKELQLCIKVAVALCTDYSEIGHSLRYDQKEILAFAEGVEHLGQIARDGEHLAELIYALDDGMAQELVPLDKRGTGLLKRVLKGGCRRSTQNIRTCLVPAALHAPYKAHPGARH